jgi:hypothetical protein
MKRAALRAKWYQFVQKAVAGGNGLQKVTINRSLLCGYPDGLSHVVPPAGCTPAPRDSLQGTAGAQFYVVAVAAVSPSFFLRLRLRHRTAKTTASTITTTAAAPIRTYHIVFVGATEGTLTLVA